MSTAVKTSAVPFSRKWHWPLEEFYRDLRVRYGIKMGLAGILALYVTQVLRLPHDNWAILTVLVMMNGQYVGSVAVKAILRVSGTIGGAVIGVWLVGDYTSTPTIFLPMENIADSVLAEGLASPAEVDQLVHELYDFARDPGTVISGPRVVQTLGYCPE